MATKTDFLKLTLPGNNEYQNTWDQPTNSNFSIISDWAELVSDEITQARHGFPSISEFLEVSINTDGTLKATDEVVKARSSLIYGDETDDEEDFELRDRLQKSDLEMFMARETYGSLREAKALRLKESMIVDGMKDANSYPTWLGYTGVNVNISGTPNALSMIIDGKKCFLSSLKQVEVSGSAGVRYIHADTPDEGLVIIDGDSTTAPPATPTGTIGSDGSKVRIFEDLTKDFTTLGVKPGHVLSIISETGNFGKYLVKEVAPEGNNNRIKITGIFPGGAESSIDYDIRDMFGIVFGADEVMDSSKFYIGEADWDGSAITAVRPMNFGNTFIGEWRAVDLTSVSSFMETWNHNLMSDALEVCIQVSQSNDGSEPVEELSMSTLSNNLGLNVVNSLTLTPGDQTLGGGVSVNLTGTINVDRSAMARWTKHRIDIKNAYPSVLYKDFSGAIKQTGYVRVVLRKKQ